MGQHLAVYRPFCRKLGTIARVCSDIYVETAMFCVNIARCIKYIAHYVKYLTVYT